MLALGHRRRETLGLTEPGASNTPAPAGSATGLRFRGLDPPAPNPQLRLPFFLLRHFFQDFHGLAHYTAESVKLTSSAASSRGELALQFPVVGDDA